MKDNSSKVATARRLNLNRSLTFIFFIVCFSSQPIQAQEYNTGIGIRFAAFTDGITVKHFMNPNSALEGIMSFSHHSFIITGLYEKQAAVNNAQGLYWFYGGGAHIGYYNDADYFYHHKKYNYNYYDGDNKTGVFGIDLILGMEYKFQKAPITLGMDIKPAFDFLDGFPGYVDWALTARFAF